ncbi:retrotransposon protein, putative, ty1-copia subclass [Tanacetum coccineum]
MSSLSATIKRVCFNVDYFKVRPQYKFAADGRWRSGDVCVNVLNEGWNPMTDLANVFEHYLPMLLKEPNVVDPLNEDAADLLLIDRPGYEAKVRGKTKQPVDSVLAEGSDPLDIMLHELKEAMSDLRAMDVDIFTLEQHLEISKSFANFGDTRSKSRDKVISQKLFKLRNEEVANGLGVVVVRPVNTWHRWDETCLLDIIVIKSMFEISGNNFNDWFRQFKMVLRVERKLFVIEQPISLASPTDSEYLRSGMRYMIHNEELKSMFEKQVGVEWFDLIQTFHACKQDEGKPVGPYHNMGKTVGELHAMLNEYKKGLPKKAETPQVMMIKGGKIQKANKKSLKAKGKNKVNGKGKDKEVYIPKPKNPKPTAMERPAKDDTCHHYKEVGHCKRNCPAYLAELIKKKKQVGTASSSDVFIIELFSFPTKSWVYDTSCGTLICNTKYGLGGVRKLKQVEAIGSFDLVLPNGLVICLDNSHYAPSITRGVVSVHRLIENGFVQCFTDFGISVSKNNVFYFNAIPSNGIYEIDIHNLVPNVNSIVST